MSPNTVKAIERAIEELSPRELEELHMWLDQRYPQPIYVSLAAATDRALDDEKTGRYRPL